MTNTIVTEYVHPPIPDRSMDWSAATDNYEPGAPLAYGPTEKAAVEDLLDNHCMARGADLDRRNVCELCGAISGQACKAILP